jgi:glycosyltransferase involved in cell wall biosynthesis
MVPVMDLVVVSLEAWDDVWRRNQHLLSRLLATDAELRVLFVEPAADPFHDVMSRRWPAHGMPPTPVPGFDGRLLRFRPLKRLPRRADSRADERLAGAVRNVAARMGMRDPVLWLNDPAAAPLARLTGWPTLYDITDDWVAADRPSAELGRIRAAETWLLLHAQAVVACSPELVRRKAGQRTGTIELIPNAVDVAAYRVPQPRPADLPSRAALYVGTLHTDRLDVALCEATATVLRNRGALVLVGPNALSTAETERLRRAGVLILGARRRDQVVGYLQHADVLVVPHLVTSFTDSLDPIKLYEYAAVGRRVISTPVAGFRDAHGPQVRVVATSEFPSAVAAALSASTPFPAGADAAVAGWDERAAAMRIVIDRMPRT